MLKRVLIIGWLSTLISVSGCSARQVAPSSDPSVLDTFNAELSKRTRKLTAYELDKNKLTADDPRWSRDLHRQARKFREEGNWRQAEIEERKLLAIREKWLGKTASDSLFSIAYLAESMRHQGRPAEALKLIDERFKLMQGKPVEDTQIGVVSLLVEKAQNLIALGRPADALPLLEEALILRKDVPRYNKYGPKLVEIEQVLAEAKAKSTVKP